MENGKISLPLALWLLGVCLALIGALGSLLYYSTTNGFDRRMTPVEVDLKVLSTSQAKLISTVEAIYNRVQSNETVLLNVSTEQARRTTNINAVTDVRSDVTKINERLIVIEQQLNNLVKRKEIP